MQHRERAVRRVAVDQVEHAARTGGGAAQQGGAALRRHELGLEQLPHRAEGERLLQLAAPRREHPPAALGGAAAHVGEQAALADAGRSLDQHQPRLPGVERVERLLQHRGLAVAVDEVVGGAQGAAAGRGRGDDGRGDDVGRRDRAGCRGRPPLRGQVQRG